MDLSIDGSMDRWMDRSMGISIDGSMDRWVDRSMDTVLGGFLGPLEALLGPPGALLGPSSGPSTSKPIPPNFYLPTSISKLLTPNFYLKTQSAIIFLIVPYCVLLYGII